MRMGVRAQKSEVSKTPVQGPDIDLAFGDDLSGGPDHHRDPEPKIPNQGVIGVDVHLFDWQPVPGGGLEDMGPGLIAEMTPDTGEKFHHRKTQDTTLRGR